MIKPQVQAFPDPVQRALRVLTVNQQGLAIEDLVNPGRVLMPADPGLEQVVNFAELLGVLKMQRVIVVVLLGPGDEQLQRLGPVLTENEVLDIECDCSSGAGLDVARNGWFSAGSYDSATEVLPIGTHRQLP